MGVATRTNRTRLFRSWCGWCHTICVRIPRAACAPKLMQERRVVTFELWWLDKFDVKKKNKSSGCRESGNRVRNRMITRSYCADQYPRTSWKASALPRFGLGDYLTHVRLDNYRTRFPPRNKSFFLKYTNKSLTMIRRGKLFLLSFPASGFYLVVFLVFTEQVLQY